ncbi:phosphotransferase family protein [Geodermatophilus sp. SYSU D00758]
MPSRLLPPPADPALAESWPAPLRLLLGPAAGELWTAVLGPLGGAPVELRATGVTHRPDGATTVRYAAEVAWAGGRRTREALAATTGRAVPPGAAVVEGEVDGSSVPVGVWRWPLDPALPGLAWAVSASAAAGRLAGLGLPVGRPRLRLRAYRPGRRGVVEVRAEGRRLFLKVVRPDAVERLAGRHALLAGAVPVPPVLAATDDGVVVLPALPGTTLRELLRGDGAGLPAPAALEAVLDALPRALARPAAGSGPLPGDGLARAGEHAAVLGAVLPALRPRLAGLTAALASAPRGAHAAVPVHGDFHEAQLLVDGGAVVGLLDVDTAGAGHRVDDWATLLAHLAVLDQVYPGAPAVPAYRDRVHAAGRERWPAAELHPRVAAVLLGLATGPFRVQQAGWPARTAARLDLAERWLAAARGSRTVPTGASRVGGPSSAPPRGRRPADAG